MWQNPRRRIGTATHKKILWCYERDAGRHGNTILLFVAIAGCDTGIYVKRDGGVVMMNKADFYFCISM